MKRKTGFLGSLLPEGKRLLLHIKSFILAKERSEWRYAFALLIFWLLILLLIKFKYLNPLK